MIKKVLMVIAAVALIGYGAISIINAIEFNSSGVETVAAVTGMKQYERYSGEDIRKNSPFEQEIAYKYTVDGKEYTGTYIKNFQSGQPINAPETVRIQYLPSRPQVSELAGEKNIPVTVAYSAALAALGAFILYSTFRRKRKEIRR